MAKVFEPGPNIVVAATTSSSSTTVSANHKVIRIRNLTTGEIYVKFGTSAVTATTSDMAIGSGHTEAFTKNLATEVGIIAAVAGNVHLTCGSGE